MNTIDDEALNEVVSGIRDNPMMITLGSPITLLIIAAALIWLPSIINAKGWTLFGHGGASSGSD